MSESRREGPAPRQFPLTDMQVAYLVGKSRLIELGGRQNYYVELDAVGVEPARAEEALNQLVHRQEHLRTVMLEMGEQRVMEGEEIPRLRIPVIDLSDADEDERSASLLATRERMSEQGGLDPTGWPLFEVVISRLRRHRSRVHLRMNLVLLDGPSLRQCITEWLELYRDAGVRLPPVTETFRDWRLSLLEFERTEEFARQWAYWEERLDSLPEAPRLPLARTPGSIESVSFTGRRSFLTKSQWDNFRANYRKHRVLPTTGLLHVYAETLGAWASSPRFCLNVVHQNMANRHSGAKDVVGQRSATLPLELDLREGDFWKRARDLQRQLFRDMANSDVTAVRIGRELAMRSGWTQRAVFPYVFTSNQGPGWDTSVVSRPAFRLVDRIQHTPQVLIDDQIRDAPDGGVSSMLDFVEEAFPPGLPDLMVSVYRRLLETLGRPDGADTDPELLPPAHRALVTAANDTGAPLPKGRLEDGFLAHAADRPEAVALVTPERTLTYGELEARSRAVAACLRARGVGREDLVPVVMAKGWEQVAAVLGVLRAGAAYCPVDAALPSQRVRELIDQCAAKAVLTQAAWLPALPPGTAAQALAVDDLPPSAERLPEPRGEETDLAYVIFTSGSTGQPKGVMIEHRAALNTVLDLNGRIGLGADDRVFGISSLSFDLSVWDVFGTLSAGATLVLPATTPRPDPLAWTAVAAQHGVTVWNSVPALAEMLAEVAGERPELGRPPVRAFLLSGDWIATTLPDRIRSIWPDARIVAMGGATEASIWSNVYEVGEVDPDWRSIPYGGPLTNQTMTVLNHRMDLCPPWAVGRIHIGGVGLARGYLGDAERTAERFVLHPATGERLYWTGDLGRYWPDGTIEFLGREDRQLKLQGFRVEPGEVEAAVRLLPAVRECVVCTDDAPDGQVQLIALVVPEPGRELDAAAVTEHLRGRLPAYMLPQRVHLVERLTLSANGKVDLAQVLASLPEAERPAPLPEDGELVKRLCELWDELLGNPGVTPDSNFFALGGNSLLALRMVNQVRVRLGADLALGQVFEAPSVRQLAACIAADVRPRGCVVELSADEGWQLFLFHVVGGSVARYIPLAEAWPGPVHAFQSRALIDDSDEAFAPDMESMAAHYREELQRRQPEGPYLLGGWSSGGLLAYEVARQLEEQGQRSSVFMIDSECREEIHPPTGELERHLAFLTGLAQGDPPAGVAEAVRAAAPGDLSRAARDAGVACGLLPPEIDLAGYERLMRVHEHELSLMAAYRPQPLDQPVLLLVATEEAQRPDPVPAWQAVCPGIRAEPLIGDHFTIAERFPEVAARVAAWLEPASAAMRAT